MDTSCDELCERYSQLNRNKAVAVYGNKVHIIKKGFSWKVLFLGFFATLYDEDFHKYAISVFLFFTPLFISTIIGLIFYKYNGEPLIPFCISYFISCFMSNAIVASKYNKWLLQNYLNRGYVPLDTEDEYQVQEILKNI